MPSMRSFLFGITLLLLFLVLFCLLQNNEGFMLKWLIYKILKIAKLHSSKKAVKINNKTNYIGFKFIDFDLRFESSRHQTKTQAK